MGERRGYECPGAKSLDIYVDILGSSGHASRGLRRRVSAVSYLQFPGIAPRNVWESLQERPTEAQKLASMSQNELPRENQEGARCPGMISPFFFENVRSDLSLWGAHL